MATTETTTDLTQSEYSENYTVTQSGVSTTTEDETTTATSSAAQETLLPTTIPDDNDDKEINLGLIIGASVGGAVLVAVIIVIIVLIKRKVIQCRRSPCKRPRRQPTVMLPSPKETNRPDSVEAGGSATGLPKVYYYDTPKSKEPGYSVVSPNPVAGNHDDELVQYDCVREDKIQQATKHSEQTQETNLGYFKATEIGEEQPSGSGSYSLAKDENAKQRKPNYSLVRGQEEIKDKMAFSNPGYRVDEEQESYTELFPDVQKPKPMPKPMGKTTTRRPIPNPPGTTGKTHPKTDVAKKRKLPTQGDEPDEFHENIKDKKNVASDGKSDKQHISELLYENPEKYRKAVFLEREARKLDQDRSNAAAKQAPAKKIHHDEDDPQEIYQNYGENSKSMDDQKQNKPNKQDEQEICDNVPNKHDEQELYDNVPNKHDEQELYGNVPNVCGVQNDHGRVEVTESEEQELYGNVSNIGGIQMGHARRITDPEEQELYGNVPNTNCNPAEVPLGNSVKGTSDHEAEDDEQTIYENQPDFLDPGSLRHPGGSTMSLNRSNVKSIYPYDRNLVTPGPIYYQNVKTVLGRETIPSAENSDSEDEINGGTTSLGLTTQLQLALQRREQEKGPPSCQ